MEDSFPKTDVRDKHLEACQGFASTLHRYLACSAPVQSIVRELAQLLNDPAIEAEERQRILRALAATLYHYQDNGPFETKEPLLPRPTIPDEGIWRKRLEQEEAVFVENLKRIMSEKGLTQTDLAQRAGLSQPAISMMLARKYRPQRRTIRHLAQVLEVPECELWPEQVLRKIGAANKAGSVAVPPLAPAVDPTP